MFLGLSAFSQESRPRKSRIIGPLHNDFDPAPHLHLNKFGRSAGIPPPPFVGELDSHMRLPVDGFADTRTTPLLDDQFETVEQELGLRLLPRRPLVLILRLLLQKRKSSDPLMEKVQDPLGELRPEQQPAAARPLPRVCFDYGHLTLWLLWSRS